MSVRASIICIVLVCVVSRPLAFSQAATPAQQPDAKQPQSTESADTRAAKAGDPSTAQQSDGQGQTDQDKKKTHRGSIVAQLFMKENRFQVQGIFADGNLNYTLFGEGFLGGIAGVRLPLSQT